MSAARYKPSSRRRRRWIDRGFVIVCIVAAMMSLAVLAVLLGAIGIQGARFLGWDFITGLPSRKPQNAGIWPAMIGSIFLCAVCAVTAIPIGVATAIMLEEYKAPKVVAKRIPFFVRLGFALVCGYLIAAVLFSAGSAGIGDMPVWCLADIPRRLLASRLATMWFLVFGGVGVVGSALITILTLLLELYLLWLVYYRLFAVHSMMDAVKQTVFMLHSFIQLNITNLAGVPSVVYGILGLTVFANAFGALGSSLTPDYAIGVRYYDSVYDLSGTMLHLRTTKDAPPLELRDGMVMYDEATGKPVTITFVDERAAEPAPGQVRATTRVSRYDDKAWYYVQLPLGRGVLAGGLTLMLVVLPIIIISSQESLRAVPNSLRQGSLALGSTKWQMIWKMTLPSAVPGIMTGSILAISRALGEAAPLLILAGIVYITFTPGNLMDSFTAMPLQIFNWASRPQQEFHDVAASGIIVLLAVLLSFNTVAVFIRQKTQQGK